MMRTEGQGGTLEVVRAGIDTYQEPVVYMREDCSVCRSEGFEAQARIEVALGDRSIIATLNVVSGDWLQPHRAARAIRAVRTGGSIDCLWELPR
jgi:thymidine phosphorylase